MKFLFSFFLLFSFLNSQTIKDIANIVGIRNNQLLGYGLVVGLPGTGDKSKFTMQSLQNLLRNSYIKIPTSSIKSKNIAAVMVTAELPAFARQGDKIKVKISAIGDAKSIDNGVLLLTQLKGVDGNVYAISQGPILADQDNLTTGYILDGAIIENEIDYSLSNEKDITLSLIKNSAENAFLVESKINERFGNGTAMATDTRTIIAKKPKDMSIIKFIALVEGTEIDSTIRKKIIIDMSRETIITGEDIRIKPVTITRDNFTLRIKKSTLSDTDWNDPITNKGVNIGDNVVIGNEPFKVNLDNALVNSKNTPTISDLVRAMKIMQLPITDIIEAIKMIKDMGAIDVDLEVRG